MTVTLRSSFLDRYLDPGSSVAEVLFGLIMTLTFTLSAGIMIKEQGAEGARELLIATVGCNLAWGVIDGVLYILGQLFDRGRKRRLSLAVQKADDATGMAIIARELDELLENVTTAEERQAVYRRVMQHVREATITHTKLTKADLLGAFASFWLVFLTSVPAAVPFLFIDDPWVALRASNAILLALLFVSGFVWARYTLARPAVVGLVFLLGGFALVVMAIALGG
jgi:hypothetical protein